MLFMFTIIINFKWINSLNFSILIYIMVNIHRYNWHKEKHPLFLPTTQRGFLIIHQEKLFPRLLIYISELKSAVSDQLPQNSIQRNSLHSKITLYQPSSSPQSLPRNHSFCRNLFMPSFLGQPGQTQRAASLQGDSECSHNTESWIPGQKATSLRFHQRTARCGSYSPQHQHLSWLMRQKLFEVLSNFLTELSLESAIFSRESTIGEKR